MDNNKTIKAVFSDLDGTILDHHTYSYGKAIKGIKLLRGENIPLILVSSKTIGEIIPLHKELKLRWPVIFENGGGLAYPENSGNSGSLRLDVIGESTDKLKEELTYLRKIIGKPLKAMSEMDIDEIIERTGLTKDNAVLASGRMTSIPFILPEQNEINLNAINSQLKKRNMLVTKGGRFYHLTSVKANKGYAVKIIIQYLMINLKVLNIESIGLGDSENDIPMLEAVDKAFLVRKHDGSAVETDIDVTVTKGIGPAGFTEAIKSIL
ncbi:MAG: HAD-IIB family hydrolase [Spirochaetes bacterium]|nr:HAD-IIB family hydrolase [Spirochaetota bacterium]